MDTNIKETAKNIYNHFLSKRGNGSLATLILNESNGDINKIRELSECLVQDIDDDITETTIIYYFSDLSMIQIPKIGF